MEKMRNILEVLVKIPGWKRSLDLGANVRIRLNNKRHMLNLNVVEHILLIMNEDKI
jgi:hypothetical protein